MAAVTYVVNFLGGRRRIAALAGAAALLSAACGGGESTVDSASGSSSETPAALLSGEFATLGGTSIDLGSLEGKDAVFWFWAPW